MSIVASPAVCCGEAFAASVNEIGRHVAGQQRELYEFLPDVDDTVVVGRWLSMTVFERFLEAALPMTLATACIGISTSFIADRTAVSTWWPMRSLHDAQVGAQNAWKLRSRRRPTHWEVALPSPLERCYDEGVQGRMATCRQNQPSPMGDDNVVISRQPIDRLLGQALHAPNTRR